MRPRRRPITTLVTTAALLAAVAADTAGQGVEVPQSDGGLLGVAPAREDAVGTPPVPLSATKVFNSTQTTYRVEIELSTLVQDRSGSLEASKYARDRVRAEKMLSITPDGFLIGPGEQRVIVSEWRRVIPQRARAAFIAFVVRAVPQVEQSDGIVIAPTARIIAARLLRIPSPDKARGRIVGFTARQAEERVLQFTTSVRNTGKVHAEPTDASFRILDSRRREVFRSRLPDGVVLPRFVRDFPITVRKRLPAGDYRAVTRLTFGRSKLTRSRRFTLTGPNLLPTRELEITALEASGEEKGPAKAVATVENTGTADAPIVLKAELLRVVDGLPDAKPLATKTVERDGSQPGSVQQIEFELGELGSGTFRVLAAVGDGRRRYNKFAADFVSDAHRSLPTRAKDLVVDNGAVLAIIAAFLIALGGRHRLARCRPGAIGDRGGYAPPGGRARAGAGCARAGPGRGRTPRARY